MASKKVKPTYFEAVVGKKAAAKIGTYKESTGGGTPIPKGEKLVDHPEIERQQQPRDEEGRFTYNSANAKPLKYGPSRGTTVPPFLKGINLTFATKHGGDVVTAYDGKIYLSGIKMNEAEFVQACKEYLESEGGFLGLTKKAKGKVGARSKEEKAALLSGIEGTLGKMKIKAVELTSIIGSYKVRKKSLKGQLSFKQDGHGGLEVRIGKGKFVESLPYSDIRRISKDELGIDSKRIDAIKEKKAARAKYAESAPIPKTTPTPAPISDAPKVDKTPAVSSPSEIKSSGDDRMNKTIDGKMLLDKKSGSKWYSENKEDLSRILSKAQKKNPTWTMGKLLTVIAKGQVKTLKELEDNF